MGGECGSERKLTEQKEGRKGTFSDLSLPLSMLPLQTGQQMVLAQASMLLSHAEMSVCVKLALVLSVHMHAAVCALEYGSAGMSVCKCFCECLSILFCLKLWAVARQLRQAAPHSARRSTEQTLPLVCGFDKQHRSAVIHHSSASHQGKSQ